MMKTRRIALTDLQIGMFVTALDQSWFRSPFLRHKFLVHSPDQIDTLKRAGIRTVTIDLERGSDLTAGRTATPPPRGVSDAVQEVTSPDIPHELSSLQRDFSAAQQARERLTHTVSRLYDHMQSSGAIDPTEAVEAVREITIVTRTLTDPAVFMAMSQGRDTDPALSTHALVTCTLSLILGHAAGLEITELQDLAGGALLHDIGLIGLPRGLLNRINNTSTVLPRKDLERYQGHPRLGAIRIEKERRFPLNVRQIIAEHHALPNGRGFPAEAAPRTTGRLSRIVMIADRYDDLLTGFGGARPLQPHDAIHRLYLEAHEQALDPVLTSMFIKRVGVFPIYSVVMLNTGERAIVTEINEGALHLPIIHVTHAPSGQSLVAPTRVDLAKQEQNQPSRSVSHVISSSSPKPPERQ